RPEQLSGRRRGEHGAERAALQGPGRAAEPRLRSRQQGPATDRQRQELRSRQLDRRSEIAGRQEGLRRGAEAWAIAAVATDPPKAMGLRPYLALAVVSTALAAGPVFAGTGSPTLAPGATRIIYTALVYRDIKLCNQSDT